MKKEIVISLCISLALLAAACFSVMRSYQLFKNNSDRMWEIIMEQDSTIQVRENELQRAKAVIKFQRDQIRNKIPSIEGSSRERIHGDMWFVDHSFKDLYIRTDSSINRYVLTKISRQ